MRWALSLLILAGQLSLANGNDLIESFFSSIAKLEFEAAGDIVRSEPDSALRSEAKELALLLFYEGQVDRVRFHTPAISKTGKLELRIIQLLYAGYNSLFYDQVKGEAFRRFYQAYSLARDASQTYLTKACLHALLSYYKLEIAQNSNAYLPYLEHYDALATSFQEKVWVVVFQLIFLSKAIDKVEPEYFRVAIELDSIENELDTNSRLLTYVYFEKALAHEIDDDPTARTYYIKTVEHAGQYPFLRYYRFFALLKLMMIEKRDRNFDLAEDYLARARREADIADTLRSSYHLNMHSAMLKHAENDNDSAFVLLQRAYFQDFALDFRRNTLEVNRLIVELDTQEKENANLRLRQNRGWLISALVGAGLLTLLSYLAYSNQRTKNRVQRKEQEVEAMRMERLLKDHELFGIDSMIAGQEMERQRLANDLHDNLGAVLATLKLHFHTLRPMIRSTDDGFVTLDKANGLLDDAYQEVRNIAHLKNAGVYAKDGLIPAIRKFSEKASVLNKLSIHVQEHGMNGRLENSLEITIFRMVQELITNVIKHAKASEIHIHLTQIDNFLNVMVEDNGIGFDRLAIQPRDHMGLYSIQKRVELMGGRATIETIVNNGTTIILDIPLK